MYRKSQVIIENKPLQGEARHLHFVSVSYSVWAYFPNNDHHYIHYPLHIRLIIE